MLGMKYIPVKPSSNVYMGPYFLSNNKKYFYLKLQCKNAF